MYYNMQPEMGKFKFFFIPYFYIKTLSDSTSRSSLIWFKLINISYMYILYIKVYDLIHYAKISTGTITTFNLAYEERKHEYEGL